MKPVSFAALVGVSFLAASGCTFPSSRHVVPANQANSLQTVQTGVVTSVRQVTIEGQRSNLGLFGGGVIGGAAASGHNGVSGALVQAAGSVAGAVAGQAVEESVTRKFAQQITIQLDDGRRVVVTQKADGGLFRDGDRVRVVSGYGGAEVAMDTSTP